MSNYTIYTENIKDIRRKRVLEVALNEVKKYDAGPNREVIYNDEFYGYHASGSNFHWCSVFVWWVFKELKFSKAIWNLKEAGVDEFYKGISNKYKNNSISSAEPGDIVFFSSKYTMSNLTHVGFVVEVINENTLRTVEGNTTANDKTSMSCVEIKNNRSEPYVMDINFHQGIAMASLV